MTTVQQNVSDIAAGSLGAVRVFERYGIDYCCGGKRPLEEVCGEKGIPTDKLLAELEAAAASATDSEVDWTTAPLHQLIRHILSRHHEFLKSELPRVAERLDKVMRVYGTQDAATLAPLPELFGGLRQELELHMHKEEMMLFPVIERYEAAVAAGQRLPPAPFGSVANPILVMEREHSSAGDALQGMHDSTKGYEIPPHACITYRSLLNGLRELEEDLHQHIHLENNILFPRAIALESANR